MMDDGLDDIVRKIFIAAKSVDMVAAHLVVDKPLAAAKSSPVTVALPELTTIRACREAQAGIITAVASGAMLPNEAEAPSAPVENQQGGLESEHLLE